MKLLESIIEPDRIETDSAPAISNTQRTVTLFAVVAPFIGLLVAVYGFWGWGFSWVDLALLVVMYAASGLGITIGFHRLFTHRSFETVRPIKFVLAVLGSMAVQGPLLEWVATHRKHHLHSDQDDDPHSPNRFGHSFLSVIAGWWHAHVGWILDRKPIAFSRYVRDIQKDRMLRRVSDLFGVWVLLGLTIPAVAGGLISGTWQGALLGFLWGGLVRVFLVHHVTWSINSVCHLWGTRPFRSSDHSRNNALFGILAFGEGWHNNHHAFPTSARHGLQWWQFDSSYLIILAMQRLGLAWRVRVPALASLHALRREDDSR